jgi:hypothetical protein
VRDAARAYGTPDFASRAGLEAILGHERSLLEELRVAEMLESGGAAEIPFDGDATKAQRQRTHDSSKGQRKGAQADEAFAEIPVRLNRRERKGQAPFEPGHVERSGGSGENSKRNATESS